MWRFISQWQRSKDKIWWEWMQNSNDKDKTENEGEWKKETYGKWEWFSRHLIGGNHQDEWKAATWELHSHQDKTKGEEIALTQAHTIFMQSNSSSINFNL